ncbi:MAG: FAD-binding oxidoreductase [Isosphaeraceae bacterium]
MMPPRFAKAVVLLNCAVPVTLLAWDAWRGQLGANPVNFAIRTTGILALIFLILTMAVTPIARLGGWGWLGQFRRTMGLCAFFHAALHFGIFFGYDRNAAVSDTLSEILKRPYLLVGTIGLVLMVPLAATSTDGMIRRLGGRRWKLLHRLAYAAAIAGAVHFFLLVKADTTRPLAFAGVLGLFLGYRGVAHYVRLQNDSRKLRSGALQAASPASAPKFWKGRLRVARIFEETPDVRTFRFVAADGPRLPFEHLPGQYLNVMLPIGGKAVLRSYTIASPPTRRGSCEITVKREEHGLSSRYLHDRIREGDTIEVSAPAGRFTFNGDEADGIVLIAGGVGITPLMAKVRHLTDLGWPGAIHLVYAARSERDIIFRDELDYLGRRHPNLRITITLSRDSGPGWAGERGRITADLLARSVPDIADRRIHLCGPDPMMAAVREVLASLGVPDGRVHVESFVRAAGAEALPVNAAASPDVNGRPTRPDGPRPDASVTFARSGKSKPMGREQTVLEASEELGVGLPYDCRAGICGQCKVRLLSGSVVMDAEDALDPGDRTDGRILACQARCLDAVVIEA